MLKTFTWFLKKFHQGLTGTSVNENETDGNDNMNEKDEKMQTPFHVTMITASDAICDLLWKRGADVHTRDMDDYGWSYKIRISLGPL